MIRMTGPRYKQNFTIVTAYPPLSIVILHLFPTALLCDTATGTSRVMKFQVTNYNSTPFSHT